MPAVLGTVTLLSLVCYIFHSSAFLIVIFVGILVVCVKHYDVVSVHALMFIALQSYLHRGSASYHVVELVLIWTQYGVKTTQCSLLGWYVLHSIRSVKLWQSDGCDGLQHLSMIVMPLPPLEWCQRLSVSGCAFMVIYQEFVNAVSDKPLVKIAPNSQLWCS